MKSKPSVKKRQAFTLAELSIVILIIGIVISVVIAADSLISKSRISAARSLTRSSPVISYKEVAFWLESSMQSSFEDVEAEDNSTLSIWRDNSIAGFNATASGSDKPTYANTINRIHAVKFNGTNQFFSIDASALNYSYYTIFLVEKRLSGQSDNYIIGDSTITTSNQSLLLGYSLDGKIIHSQGGSNSYTANVESYANSKERARTLVFTNSPSGKTIHINGILAASSSDNARLSGISTLKIGKGYSGEIGEIIVLTKALANSERQGIEAYLAKKYSGQQQATSVSSCIGGTVTSNGCQSATCTIAATNGFNAQTGLAYASSATAITNPCQAGFTGSPTYTCTANGTATVNGSCTAITCSVAATNNFAAQTVNYAASATTLSNPCQSGFTASSPVPTYTCTTQGATVTPTGSCGASSGTWKLVTSSARAIGPQNFNWHMGITVQCNANSGQYVGDTSVNGATVSGGTLTATNSIELHWWHTSYCITPNCVPPAGSHQMAASYNFRVWECIRP